MTIVISTLLVVETLIILSLLCHYVALQGELDEANLKLKDLPNRDSKGRFAKKK